MSPRCTLTLRLLRQAGSRGVTIGEFLDAGVGTRYGARLEELRKAGYQIETRRQGSGSIYTLVEVGRGNGLTPPSSEAPSSSPAVISPSPDVLFEVEPRRTGHYDSEAA